MSGIDATWLVAALAGGILWELVKVRKALEHHLDRQRHDHSKLLVRLFGDERMERQIESANEVGATLTDEQVAYTPGLLQECLDVLKEIRSK